MVSTFKEVGVRGMPQNFSIICSLGKCPLKGVILRNLPREERKRREGERETREGRRACKWVQKLRREERGAWRARSGDRVRSNRHILWSEDPSTNTISLQRAVFERKLKRRKSGRNSWFSGIGWKAVFDENRTLVSGFGLMTVGAGDEREKH
ncbi:hypothetical protein VNO80_08366 [Phaseolus coccineus]|uniref:Uncharacterized protein n=1 Tax=Phaseolus coccineus TaxID=3886 RepID=A0AAN9NQE6_PHACN